MLRLRHHREGRGRTGRDILLNVKPINHEEPRVDGRLMRPHELAEALSVSKRGVLYQHAKGRIPARFREGRVIRFNLQEVMEALTTP